MFLPFLVGTSLGFLGAIPVAGPVSALVLRFGLRGQFRSGRALAFGAGLAEAVYVLFAFFGFNLILSSFPWIGSISNWFAAAVLVGIGCYFIATRNQEWTRIPTASQRGTKGSFGMGFGVSIVNPTLMATWTTVITTLSGFHLFEFKMDHSISFAVGVWAGTGLWFSMMLQLIRVNRERFSSLWIKRLLLGMGCSLLLMGFAAARRAMSAPF